VTVAEICRITSRRRSSRDFNVGSPSLSGRFSGAEGGRPAAHRIPELRLWISQCSNPTHEPAELVLSVPAAVPAPPKVDSAVVQLTRAMTSPPWITGFSRICQPLFRQKRKKIRNNLIGPYDRKLLDSIPATAKRASSYRSRSWRIIRSAFSFLSLLLSAAAASPPVILKFHDSSRPFAPSPTGFLHIGSAGLSFSTALRPPHRRHDDPAHRRYRCRPHHTSFARFHFRRAEMARAGLGRGIRQSDRLALHQQLPGRSSSRVWRIAISPRQRPTPKTSRRGRPMAFQLRYAGAAAEEAAPRRAGEPFVLRFRVLATSRGCVEFHDNVFGHQSKSAGTWRTSPATQQRHTDLPHGLLRRRLDLRISPYHPRPGSSDQHFKHVLIFEAAGAVPPQFAHLPYYCSRWIEALEAEARACSSVTPSDGGFLSHAFVTSCGLLGWSPKDNREQMTRQELVDAFSFEGINHSNAVGTSRRPIRSIRRRSG